MTVRYIGKRDTAAFKPDGVYEVIAIEKGWYRVMTEFDEDYLYPPDVFEVVDSLPRQSEKQIGVESSI